MTGFPSDTPKKSDVDQNFEHIRDDMELFYIEKRLQEIDREARERGEDPWADMHWSSALSRTVAGYLDESECQAIKDESVAAVTRAYDYLESIYATFFDDAQQAQLEHMIGKYIEYHKELDALAEGDSIKRVDELLEEWDEAAAQPFQEGFLAPLPGAITRHRDIAGHLLVALEMEAAAQVTLRRAFADFPAATRAIMGSGGSIKPGHFSIATAVAGLVIPPAAVVFGLLSLGTALLGEIEQQTVLTFSMEEKSDASFFDLTLEMNKGMGVIADSLDVAREKAVETLKESMQSVGLDLERYKTLPKHYVPGGEMLG